MKRSTVKVSYSTMPNMAKQMSQHNSKVSSGDQVAPSGGCNGHRGGEQCPLPGDCMAKGVVYGAEITDTSTGEKETYTGLTDGTIRDRISGHMGNCRHRHQPGNSLYSCLKTLYSLGQKIRVAFFSGCKNSLSLTYV